MIVYTLANLVTSFLGVRCDQNNWLVSNGGGTGGPWFIFGKTPALGTTYVHIIICQKSYSPSSSLGQFWSQSSLLDEEFAAQAGWSLYHLPLLPVPSLPPSQLFILSCREREAMKKSIAESFIAGSIPPFSSPWVFLLKRTRLFVHVSTRSLNSIMVKQISVTINIFCVVREPRSLPNRISRTSTTWLGSVRVMNRRQHSIPLNTLSIWLCLPDSPMPQQCFRL